MFRKIIISVLFVLLFVNLSVATEKNHVSNDYFQKFREKASKITPYSPADYALGRELLKAMKELAKKRKPMFARPLLFARTQFWEFRATF